MGLRIDSEAELLKLLARGGSRIKGQPPVVRPAPPSPVQQASQSVPANRPDPLLLDLRCLPSVPQLRAWLESFPASTSFDSKLEQRYVTERLEPAVASGLVTLYRREPFTLKWARRTTWTPDFALLLPDGSLELHETKGYQRTDDAIQQKTAAALFPMFRVVLVKHEKRAWFIKAIG